MKLTFGPFLQQCALLIFFLFDSAHDQCACLVRCRPYWTPRFLSSKCDAVPSWYLVEGFRVTKSRGGGSAGSVGLLRVLTGQCDEICVSCAFIY